MTRFASGLRLQPLSWCACWRRQRARTTDPCAVAAGAARFHRRGDLSGIRRLGAAQGWLDRPPARLLQPEQGRIGGYSDRAEQPDRTGRPGLWPADALRAKPAPRRVRDSRPEGLRQQEADVDDHRERADHVGRVLDEPCVLDRFLRARRQRQQAARDQVRGERTRADGPAARLRANVVRGRRPAGATEALGIGCAGAAKRRGRGTGRAARPRQPESRAARRHRRRAGDRRRGTRRAPPPPANRRTSP